MAFYCPACLPPTNPCLIYLTLTIKPKGVIHSHLSAALLKHGGEMAVGNSRPLYRSSATLSYLHLSFHETFDIIFTPSFYLIQLETERDNFSISRNFFKASSRTECLSLSSRYFSSSLITTASAAFARKSLLESFFVTKAISFDTLSISFINLTFSTAMSTSPSRRTKILISDTTPVAAPFGSSPPAAMARLSRFAKLTI